MSDSRFFEKLMHADDHDEAGNPMPINNVGMTVALPTRTTTGVLTAVSQNLSILPAASLRAAKSVARILPKTRIVETSSHLVASALLTSGQYKEIDEPSKDLISTHEADTKAHIACRSKRDQQVAVGNEPAPDASDPQPVDETTEVQS